MLSRVAPMVWAKVVFPTWRGPSNPTAGRRLSRSRTTASTRRGIIHAIMAQHSRFAGLWRRLYLASRELDARRGRAIAQFNQARFQNPQILNQLVKSSNAYVSHSVFGRRLEFLRRSPGSSRM